MIELRLQFFAKDGPGGERTEQPTAKKLTDARHKGQVAKSREIPNAFGLISLFLILKLGISFVGTNLIDVFGSVYARIPGLVTYWGGSFSSKDMFIMLNDVLLKTLLILAPFLVVGFLVAFVTEFVQVKWHITLHISFFVQRQGSGDPTLCGGFPGPPCSTHFHIFISEWMTAGLLQEQERGRP